MKILLVLLQVLLLSGAGTVEEVDESEMERFDHLAANPVPVNLASTNRLLSCGLFSSYQVASLKEYIRTNGDILSATELGTVAGFTPELASALKRYLSFESHSATTAPRNRKCRQQLMIRDAGGTAAGKYDIRYGEIAELHLSQRDRTVASLALNGKRPWKVVAGNYNARFGQGLLVWSGFSLSGVPLSSAFRKNASGFSASGSFSPAFTGIAADYCGEKFRAGAACDNGGTILASSGWYGRTASAGINLIRSDALQGFSADASLNAGHFCFFAEAAYCGAPAGLAGLHWAPAYGSSLSVLARYYSPEYASPCAGAVRTGSKVRDETGLCAAAGWRFLTASFDWALHPEKLEQRKNNYQQIKAVLDAQPSFKAGRQSLSARIRLEEKMNLSPAGKGMKAEWRHALRSELGTGGNGLQFRLRADCILAGAKPEKGVLGSLEAGYRTPSDSARLSFSLHLRATACNTSSWDSRIYLYEKDIPGTFNVRAWYDRSQGAAMVAGFRFRHKRYRHSADFSAGVKNSGAGSRKGLRTSLKIQYSLSL